MAKKQNKTTKEKSAIKRKWSSIQKEQESKGAVSKLFNLLRYYFLSFIFDKRENFTVFPYDFIAVFESSALFIKICFHFFLGK